MCPFQVFLVPTLALLFWQGGRLCWPEWDQCWAAPNLTGQNINSRSGFRSCLTWFYYTALFGNWRIAGAGRWTFQNLSRTFTPVLLLGHFDFCLENFFCIFKYIGTNFIKNFYMNIFFTYNEIYIRTPTN